MGALSGPRPAIAVVHLVWAPLGVAPLRRFVASYRRNPAGREHELIVLVNGLGLDDRGPSRDELVAELDGVEHTEITTPTPMLDIAAYLHAAGALSHNRLCFLNSHSEILASDWLGKLDGALCAHGVGAVAATGSWVSNRSLALHSLGLPSAYRDVMPSRPVAREQFAQIQATSPSDWLPAAPVGRMRAFLANAPALASQLVGFDRFPATHLRTNAFMLSRDVFNGLRAGRLATKMDTYRFESGRHGMTKQIRGAGKRVLVVDRDGATHEPELWDRSRTLYQDDQEGLLIADNQTRLYETGDADRRLLLSVLAWGRRPAPSSPPAQAVDTVRR